MRGLIFFVGGGRQPKETWKVWCNGCVTLLTQSDATLIARTLAGGTTAFGVLVERYEARLLRYAQSITHDADDAADVVQEAFINIYEHLHSYDSNRSFSSWAYRIVHNGALNWVRRAKRLVTGEAAQLRLERTPTNDSPERAYAAVERHTQLTAALAVLPGQYQSVLRLRYLEERSYDEIGRRLRLPLGTVATHLSRAKSLLRSYLEKRNEPTEYHASDGELIASV